MSAALFAAFVAGFGVGFLCRLAVRAMRILLEGLRL